MVVEPTNTHIGPLFLFLRLQPAKRKRYLSDLHCFSRVLKTVSLEGEARSDIGPANYLTFVVAPSLI
jgi:hypothetical protein